MEVIILSLGLGDRINAIKEKNQRLELEATKREQERKRLERELSLARQIQRAILPQQAPQMPRLKIAARYVSADAVGGDLYDFYKTSEGIGVLVADVSGHGIPAALLSGMLKVIGTSHLRLATEPAKFLDAINSDLVGRDDPHFITGAYGFFNIANQTLCCSNAGHPSIFQIREGAICTRLRPYGRILGIFEKGQYEAEEVAFQTGDRFVFFTDGLIEAMSPEEIFYGNERLHSDLLELANENIEDACDALLNRVRRWQGKPAFDDDLTLVMVDINEK
jgi:serine phosphatase RsbU (regulator of sigma subunit)